MLSNLSFSANAIQRQYFSEKPALVQKPVSHRWPMNPWLLTGMPDEPGVGIRFPGSPRNLVPGYNHHLQNHGDPLIRSGKNLSHPPSLLSQPHHSPFLLSSHLLLNISCQTSPAKTCSFASSPKCNVHLPSSFPICNCILLLSYCPTPSSSFSFSHYSHFPFSPLILPTSK